MEVRAGYKQTEVGIIPEDWEVHPLSTVGTFSKGQGVRKNEAASGEIPCIRYGEIYTHHNDVVRTYNSYISRAVAGTSKRLTKGDVLFAGSGETKEEIGKAVAFLDDGEVYAGGDIVILSPRNQSSEFLGYLLNAPMVVRQKASKGQGDAVVHISSTALGAVVVPLPSFNEQRAIATALSDVDALLAAQDKLIAKKRDIKQAAMQQLLTGKQRLPGFSGEWVSCELKRFVREFEFNPDFL
jgi:type I restriction enzyme S subunit